MSAERMLFIEHRTQSLNIYFLPGSAWRDKSPALKIAAMFSAADVTGKSRSRCV